MKTLCLLLSFSPFLISCLGGPGSRTEKQNASDDYARQYSYEPAEEDYEEYEEYKEYADYEESGEKAFKPSRQNTGTKTTHQLRDARTGLIVSSATYPSAWQVISKPSYTIDQKLPSFLIQITGPDNLQSFNTPVTYHVHYQDPQMAQWMYNTPYGKLSRPLASPQRIFNEEVRPRMEKSGYQYLGEREQPDVTRYLQNKMASKFSMNTSLSIFNTEWKNESGQKALAGITLVSMQQPAISGAMMVWYYSVTYTFVNEEVYEQTLERMKEATFSFQENPEWEQYVSQLRQQRAFENQQRLQLAAAQHQNRMQANQAAFNAHQEKMKGIWAAQDANHASFMNRNFGPGSDTGQRQFLNMINEEETVYNPLTGSNYQVNAGSMEYWMDSDGNYIRNDDAFYTPNGDINLNNREWVKVERAY